MNGQCPLSENRVTKGQMNEIVFKPVSVSVKFIIQIYSVQSVLVSILKKPDEQNDGLSKNRVTRFDRGRAFDPIQNLFCVSISMVFLFDHMFHVTRDVYLSSSKRYFSNRETLLSSKAPLIEHNRVSFSTFKTLCIGNRVQFLSYLSLAVPLFNLPRI